MGRGLKRMVRAPPLLIIDIVNDHMLDCQKRWGVIDGRLSARLSSQDKRVHRSENGVGTAAIVRRKA